MNTIGALIFDANFHIHYIRERKKNIQIKGLVCNTSLVLQYTVQLVISNSCTNFKILGQVVTEKSLTKTSIYYVEERDRKGKYRKKKTKIILTTLVLFTTMHLIVFSMYTKYEDSSTYKC